MDFARGRFRARGDVVEVHPATFDEEAIRIEFFGDEIDLIPRFDPLTGQTRKSSTSSHFIRQNSSLLRMKRCKRALARSVKNLRTDQRTRIAKQSSSKRNGSNAHRVRSGNVAGDGFLQRD